MSDTPFFPDNKVRSEVAQALEENPLIWSLLYDIDLLPEQIKDERRYNYMLAVIDHMRQALRGEHIGKKCGLRKDAEFEKGDF